MVLTCLNSVLAMHNEPCASLQRMQHQGALGISLDHVGLQKSIVCVNFHCAMLMTGQHAIIYLYMCASHSNYLM